MTIPKAPYELTDERTIPAMVDCFAETYPDQLFIIAEDGSGTTVEFAEACKDVANRLRSLGLNPGDRIGLLMANGWRWMATAVGAQTAGLVVVCLNTWHREAELQASVRKTSVKLIVSQRTLWGQAWDELLDRAGLLRRDVDRDYLGTIYWEKGADLEIASPIDGRTSRIDCKPADFAFFAFTSGSSALPKVVTLTHEDLMDNCYQIGRRQALVPGDRLWMATPLFFGLGCANGIPVAITNGATLCVQERFEPRSSAAFIQEHQCTVYYGLGPMTRALIESGAHRDHDISSLRTGITAFSPEEKRLAIEELGITGICSPYGLTEGYGHSTMTHADDDLATKLYTQGTVVPTQEIRIVDPETGVVHLPARDSLHGEIQLRGCVTPGYLDDPEVNAQTFTADGWFRTGDMGRLDEEARLHYSGRLKEIIKVNGITVAPAEVEAIVADHPSVDEAYAFGWLLSGRDDETLCCAVVLKSGEAADTGIAEALRGWMRARVASYKIPGELIFLNGNQLPMTDSGKVNKRLIGERFIDAKST